MKRLAVICSAALLLGALAWAAGTSSAQTGGPMADATEAHVELAKTFKPAWQAECELDSCALNILARETAQTPAAVDTVDIVVTVTSDFKTSRGDQGELIVAFKDEAAPSEERDVVMEPGPFALMSTSRTHRTSSTLAWVAKDVAAAGRSYIFQVTARADDGDGDDRARFSGKKLTVVIDMTPSDD